MKRQLPFVALDNAQCGHEHVTVFAEAAGVVVARQISEIGAAFAAIESALARGLHVAGYFSYELGYALEPRLVPLMPKTRHVPLLWFGLFRRRDELFGPGAAPALASLARGRAYAAPITFDETAASYAAAFKRVQDYIGTGDIYQANITFGGRLRVVGDPLDLYLRLRPHASAAYCAYIEDGERTVLSFSPELFFHIEDGAITAKPMKGTAPREADIALDEKAREDLRLSDKDRAENLMIVDLIRNDLARAAVTGSVRVDELFAVETYPTVHQMVSTVRARLRAGMGPREIVQALFPCGSVTGAPKIRAIEVIAELERKPRGIYCGAIGYFSPDGEAEFNVAIRTLTIAGGYAELGVGSGLVADSRMASEFAECLIKAQFVEQAHCPLSLIETLRFVPGEGFVRLPLHMERMRRSASVFGLAFDEFAARAELQSLVTRANSPQRVRMELHESGSLKLEAKPLEAIPQVWTYAISDWPVQSTDPLLLHKTGWREHFEEEFVRLSRLTGCAEVIFVNERGEITEGSRSSVFARFGQSLVTPPLSCGLLDGCFRRAMLGDSAARCAEGVLFADDLALADAVYLGNSVRGLIAAVPVSRDRRVA
ncbi:MAG: aminodeoxychorismate synthase component I [Alphaproteobacteria bacterium]